MLTKEKIWQIVENKIKSDENIYSGSAESAFSGHLDYRIEEISDPVETENGYKVTFEYITVISGYSIWPGNTPCEYLNEKSIIIDKTGKIIDESEKISSSIGGGELFDRDL